jgi:hypothetical protein
MEGSATHDRPSHDPGSVMPYYVHRVFRHGVTSCGGPYAGRAEAIRIAANLSPPNALGVRVTSTRRDPRPRPGRGVIVRTRWKRGDPGSHVVAGPFASADDVRRFLEAAHEPVHRPITGYTRPLGRRDDWEPAKRERRRVAALPARGRARSV